MAKQKFYTKEKEINGVKYVAQFNGISAALDAMDSGYIEGSSNTSIKKMTTYIFENVIVEPKGLTCDDFESIEDLNEVLTFGRNVMDGKFREVQNKEPVK